MIFTGFCTAVYGQANHHVVNNLALEADSINLLARRYLLNGKRDSAKFQLDKALEIAHRSGNITIIARCYVDFTSLYLFQAKYKQAQQSMEQAWPYLEMTDHYDVKISGILQRANLYNVLDRKDSSIFYYRLAEAFNEKKNPYRNWAVYMAMGELFNQMDDVKEAENYFMKAYKLTAAQEGKPDHVYLLTVFLNFLMARNKTDGAGALIAEYNEQLKEAKQKKTGDPLHTILMSLTNVKLEDNVAYMKSVKEASLKDGQVLQALIANGYIVNYYEKKKKFDEAISYATEGEQLAARTGSLRDLYSTTKVRYGLLQKAGKYSEANALADKLFVFKDSMLSLQRWEQLYEMETRFETQKKEKEIALLNAQKEVDAKAIALLNSKKKLSDFELLRQLDLQSALVRENTLMDSIVGQERINNELLTRENGLKKSQLQKEQALMAATSRENILKANELAKEKKTRRIMLAGSAILLLAGGIIFYQYRRQKAKSRIIQKQSDNLQVLMKEIHHRVKNNLQVISSLLDLQSLTIADSQASEAVKEGKNRVQSMALIHQNLYSEDNIKGIKAKAYISNLLQSLCDSYNINNDKVKLNTEIDDLNLDVDTMIPLGLVMNELVSNSLKYAFKDGRNGELNIILREEPQHLLLRVSDNGTGYPEGVNAKDSKSFGMKMIRAFAQKLKAKLDIYNNDGAVVQMEITKYNLA